MDFIFEQIRVGGDKNLSYLIGDTETKNACVVDPSFDPEFVLQRAEEQQLKVSLILNTHSHDDHTNGNDVIKKETGAKMACWHSSTIEYDIPLKDKDVLNVGKVEIQILHTPGHIEDHVVFFLPAWKILLTGDHLFVGRVGKTMGEKDAITEYGSLRKLFDEFPLESTVWPGHDYGCRPVSTLLLEKNTNPFLIVNSQEDFLQRKKEWLRYKREKGLR